MSVHSRSIPNTATPNDIASNAITTSLERPEPPPAALPWYRSESWLAVMLAGFVPLVVAVVGPDAAQYPLIGLSGFLIVIGAVMLIRQGVFRPPTGAEPHGK